MYKLGWQEIDPLTSKNNSKNSSKENMLPNVSKGDGTTTKSADCKEGKTTPPSHYNEASLLTTMDTAGRNLEDEELKTGDAKRRSGYTGDSQFYY